MIPFEHVRAALLDPDPYIALDRLVRDQMAAGRKTAAISDDLVTHLGSVRAMPEYIDEMEDQLGDTMDALNGWCLPSCAYRDPDPAALNGHPAADHPAPARSAE